MTPSRSRDNDEAMSDAHTATTTRAKSWDEALGRLRAPLSPHMLSKAVYQSGVRMQSYRVAGMLARLYEVVGLSSVYISTSYSQVEESKSRKGSAVYSCTATVSIRISFDGVCREHTEVALKENASSRWLAMSGAQASATKRALAFGYMVGAQAWMGMDLEALDPDLRENDDVPTEGQTSAPPTDRSVERPTRLYNEAGMLEDCIRGVMETWQGDATGKARRVYAVYKMCFPELLSSVYPPGVSPEDMVSQGTRVALEHISSRLLDVDPEKFNEILPSLDDVDSSRDFVDEMASYIMDVLVKGRQE